MYCTCTADVNQRAGWRNGSLGSDSMFEAAWALSVGIKEPNQVNNCILEPPHLRQIASPILKRWMVWVMSRLFQNVTEAGDLTLFCFYNLSMCLSAVVCFSPKWSFAAGSRYSMTRAKRFFSPLCYLIMLSQCEMSSLCVPETPKAAPLASAHALFSSSLHWHRITAEESYRWLKQGHYFREQLSTLQKMPAAYFHFQ